MLVDDLRVESFENIQNFTPLKVIRITSIDQLIESMATIAAHGHRARACGARESWSPYAKTYGTSINLLQLNNFLQIDETRKTVVVDAGVRLGDLSRALSARGLSLPSLPFNPRVTIGGAVTTATHGTSAKWGTLSDSVISIQIVTASGELKRIDERAHPDEMMAARTAVGMLGVIARVELQAIDIPWVRFSELNLDLAAFRASAAELTKRYDHIWAHWTFGSDKVRIECLKAEMEQGPGFHRYGVIDNLGWKPPSDIKVSPWQSLMLRGRDRLRRFRRQVWMSMQYAVPLGQIDDVIDMIKGSEFYRLNPGRVLEFKFLKGNQLSFLGPNTDGDAALLNLWWLVDWDKRATIFASFERLMRAVYARPHWGKAHQPPDTEYLQRAFPDWAKFERIRQDYDPAGLFSIFG